VRVCIYKIRNPGAGIWLKHIIFSNAPARGSSYSWRMK
jgi:hypothetical protein